MPVRGECGAGVRVREPEGLAFRAAQFRAVTARNRRIRAALVALDREFADVVPPQQRIDESWYQGTADAVYQNIFAIAKEDPDYVVILAGDHIYKMNYHNMLRQHIESGANLTIGVLPVAVDVARNQFGVMETDADQRVVGFEEKPSNPRPIIGDPDTCLASMGIYVFSARFLYEELCRDATRRNSRHDFGCDIIPSIIDSNRVFAYRFMDENRKTEAYWRDVGTLDAYYDANMDLVGVDPQLNLYDEDWPITTYHPNLPPAKFVFAEEDRTGHATDSIVCPGTILSGGSVSGSVLGYSVRINSYATVEDSIIFSNVNIGRNAKIRRAIIDKGVSIPAGMEIGFDPERDRANGFSITDNGITVIAKNDALI